MPYPDWRAGQRVTAALLAAAQPATVVKAASQPVTSSTTLVNDNHLLLAVAANATYALTGFLDYDGAFGAGGLKVGWTLPFSATLRWGLRGNVVADTTQKFAANTVTQASTLSVGTYGTGGSHSSAHLIGHLTVGSTAGSVQLRWAQDASNAVATTMWDLSWLSLRRLT